MYQQKDLNKNFVYLFQFPATNNATNTNNQLQTIKLKKMKNFIIATAAGCILAMATTKGANAQNSSNSNSQDKQIAINKMDKSVFRGETNTANSATSAINSKALTNFKKSYKNASDEKWTKNKNDFTVQFTSNGVNNMIFYDQKGNWAGSLKVYQENKLDRNVRAIVKSKYFDYKITLVQEVETTASIGTPIYIVHLEGDNGFKNIRVTDGVMDVYTEFSK